ncbi:CHASE2 domain-containing protein [Thiomicrorhabdus indica]|uniref:CHASE2 domain-containing protein n=1 Tax=Thiomicrorhabdus indica TaxID=2267253 RepID=UPI00102D8448|nr:CHASE2 domain-containing protein [Thiomicrorhabdus indica]
MKAKYSRNSSFIRKILFILVLLATALLYLNPSWTRPMDYVLQDMMTRLLVTETVPKEIVIVDIDDQSLQNIQSWPWSRELLAQLIENLFTLHHPKGLAIDMVMPEPRDEVGESRLQTLLQSYPICLAIAFDLEINNTPRQVGEVSGGAPAGETALVSKGFVGNHAALAQHAQCTGHISPWVDNDGLIRRLPQQVRFQDQQWPMIAQSLYQKVNPNQVLPESTRWLTIPYRIQANHWQSVPAQDILLQTLPAGYLDDKYLLLGSSALGLSDRVATPIHPWLPGVAIHAGALYKLLHPVDSPVWAKPVFVLIYALTAVAILAMLFFWSQTFWVLIASLGMGFGWLLLMSFALYGNQIMPWSLPLVALALLIIIQFPFEWLVVDRYNRRITRLFQGYLSKDVVNQLIESRQDVLEPSVREVTVLFADIEGFTKLSEKIPTAELARITKDVLHVLTQEVHSHQGTLDKYIGDAVMALWNAPLDQADHADLAVRSAVAMLESLDLYNQSHPQQPKISVRIGIHTGPAMVGDLGTEQRHTYTAIGDTVNLAHRLHEWSKDYQTHILLSRETADMMMSEVPQNCEVYLTQPVQQLLIEL